MTTLTTNPEKLLYPAEAARMLSVSVAWLARQRWKGTGPAYVRIGGPRGRAIRYRLSDLIRWIRENAVNGSQGGANA